MKLFVYVVIFAVIIAGMLFCCHRKEIVDMRDDYQAYSTRSLLPDDNDEGAKND